MEKKPVDCDKFHKYEVTLWGKKWLSHGHRQRGGKPMVEIIVFFHTV